MIKFDMVRYYYKSLLILGLFFLMITDVQSDGLISDISDKNISIETQFTGKDLLLYGSIETEEKIQSDIIITVIGPEYPLIVRKKDKKYAMWINDASYEYSNVPSYYSVYSNRPLENILDKLQMKKNKIGINNLSFTSRSELDNEDVKLDLFEAIVRHKKIDKLFSEDANGVTIKNNKLYKSNIHLPSGVKEGRLKVTIFLIRDGNIVNKDYLNIYLNKRGVGKIVYDVANKKPFIYGIIAVLFALLLGWSMAVIVKYIR